MNGKPVQPGYGINILDEKLEISKADMSHEANFSCFASNLGGSASWETQVNVLCMFNVICYASFFNFSSLFTSKCGRSMLA